VALGLGTVLLNCKLPYSSTSGCWIAWYIIQSQCCFLPAIVAAAAAVQVMKAFAEAEAHKGVSLIVAYAPCVMQGISEGMSCSVNEARAAVEVGYWPLYRCARILFQ
jgi:pyruvate/2-oxoacid:ferredoxin oxidoreductase beta subunit